MFSFLLVSQILCILYNMYSSKVYISRYLIICHPVACYVTYLCNLISSFCYEKPPPTFRERRFSLMIKFYPVHTGTFLICSLISLVSFNLIMLTNHCSLLERLSASFSPVNEPENMRSHVSCCTYLSFHNYDTLQDVLPLILCFCERKKAVTRFLSYSGYGGFMYFLRVDGRAAGNSSTWSIMVNK